MHQNALQFLSRFAPFFRHGASILEIGSLNLNGSPRSLFPGENYLGIDLVAGSGVDVVSSGDAFDTDRRFELVICAEVLEHAPVAREICHNAFRLLVPGGLFLVTTAGYGRRPHSAVDGDHLRAGEFYRNVLESDLRDWLSPFSTVLIDLSVFGDICAFATKGGNP